mmetsp:Transcript_7190/g.16366  ORF Transcript_7190/g.16366 Transcript_7190/m.16366 type:complete len:93 (+) Transcript_7190:1458-1736(+)
MYNSLCEKGIGNSTQFCSNWNSNYCTMLDWRWRMMDFAVAASISGGGVRRTRDRRCRRCSLSAVGDNEHDVDGVILEEISSLPMDDGCACQW